jgi:ribosomal protein S18 acetylase RimI-like enzyme
MTTSAILTRLETYYDAVPRARADAEEIGPFTLFVARSEWPFYARPRLGDALPRDPDDVTRVVQRQRELGVPVQFEWVAETSPGLDVVVARAGLHVERCPLVVLAGEPDGDTRTARMLGPDEIGQLVASRAAISVGFETGGTAVGPEAIAARDAAVGIGFADVGAASRSALARGELRAAACYAAEDVSLGPVGGGAHSPVFGVSEIAGIAVLPAFRRRGLAGALSLVLARDALAAGATTVFCSAQSDEVARVYERVGFRRTATACIATLPVTAGS